MNTNEQPGNPLPDGAVSRNSNSLGLVTRAMCQVRARELAKIAGRPSHQVWQADYLQAKRELTGETDPDLQDAILDSVPYPGNWDPASGMAWHRPPEPSTRSAKPEAKPGQIRRRKAGK
jgi:hypothetical protein